MWRRSTGRRSSGREPGPPRKRRAASITPANFSGWPGEGRLRHLAGASAFVQHAVELVAGGDAELEEHLAQVVARKPRRGMRSEVRVRRVAGGGGRFAAAFCLA